MVAFYEAQFPVGTPVCVTLTTERRGRPLRVEVVAVIEGWEDLPTGSWFAHGKDDKLWLKRLRLRKVDGEITLLVIDDTTAIAKIEAAGGVKA